MNKRKAWVAIKLFDGELMPWTSLGSQSTLNAHWCAHCAIEQSMHFPGVYPCRKSSWWDYRLKPVTYRFIWRIFHE